MPRKPRMFVPGYPAHIVQRGHNRAATFHETEDYFEYLRLLDRGSERYGCSIHAYVLMTNHVHLLATPDKKDSISRMMQFVGRHYVPFINEKYERKGTLWDGRFKACLVDSDRYVLACYRYIELNPVRAGMVGHPSEYRWSSFNANTGKAVSSLLIPHAVYLGLASQAPLRSSSYLQLFSHEMEHEEVQEIRACVKSGTPYCPESWLDGVEAVVGRALGYKAPGRPLGSKKGL